MKKGREVSPAARNRNLLSVGDLYSNSYETFTGT